MNFYMSRAHEVASLRMSDRRERSAEAEANWAWENFNRLVITDATQQVLSRILLGKRTSLLKLCEHPSHESTPVTNDELRDLNLDFENFMAKRKG